MGKYDGVRWRSQSTYIDTDTGEIISRTTAKDKTKYIIVKTTKEVKVNEIKTKGLICYTIQCRRQPQTRINYAN